MTRRDLRHLAQGFAAAMLVALAAGLLTCGYILGWVATR